MEFGEYEASLLTDFTIKHVYALLLDHTQESKDHNWEYETVLIVDNVRMEGSSQSGYWHNSMSELRTCLSRRIITP